MLDGVAAAVTGVDVVVEILRGVDLFLCWLDPNRGIAGDFAVFIDGGGVGQHPVEAAVFAAIFNQSQPGLARMQGVPQVLKGGGRHVGVADQVVSLADELFAGVSADFNKGRVGVGEPAFFIGFGDQVLVGADFGFDVVYG